MVETVFFYKALSWIFSIDHIVDLVKIGRSAVLKKSVIFKEHGFRIFYAFAGQRMGGKKSRQTVSAGKITKGLQG